MLFEAGVRVTAKCAECRRDLPDWEARTAGAGKPVAELRGEDGGGFVLDTLFPCSNGCSCSRVHVSFSVG